MHFAAQEGHSAIVDLLLENGAVVNALDEDDWIALHFAVLKGNIYMTRTLLSYKANPNLLNKNNWTPLHFAVQENFGIIVDLLLSSGAKINDSNKNGVTPLHVASYWGYSTIVKKLITHGADLNAITKDNGTPLHAATYKGHSAIVQLLLDYGANVDYLNRNKVTSLYLAAEKGYLEIGEKLIKHNADVNFVNSEHNITPLHVATVQDHVYFVQKLLDYGAKVDALDDANRTALHFAVKKSNAKIFNLLIENGADWNIKNSEGQTVLQEIQLSIESLELKIKTYKPNMEHITKSKEKMIENKISTHKEVMVRFGCNKFIDLQSKANSTETKGVVDKEEDSKTVIINDNEKIIKWINKLEQKKKMLNIIEAQQEKKQKLKLKF